MKCPHCGKYIDKNKVKPEMLKKIIQLSEAGMSSRAIAEKLGSVISYTTVSRYVTGYQSMFNLGLMTRDHLEALKEN
jgi:predicted transcriptional regulator